MTATGFPREEVLSNEVPVSVNPALTVLVGPVAGGAGALHGYIENPAGSGQTLLVKAQTRWNANRPWVDLAAINMGQFDTQLADGEPRDFYIELDSVREVRLIGYASGGGMTANVCARKITVALVR